MSSQQNVRAHSRRVAMAAASLLLVLAAVGIGPAQVDLPAAICAGLHAVVHVHACQLTLHTALSACPFIPACRLQGAMNKNVLGGDLKSCCQSPKTGFYRDGFCRVGPEDGGEQQ